MIVVRSALSRGINIRLSYIIIPCLSVYLSSRSFNNCSISGSFAYASWIKVVKFAWVADGSVVLLVVVLLWVDVVVSSVILLGLLFFKFSVGVVTVSVFVL